MSVSASPQPSPSQPGGPRSKRRHTPKVNMKGLYQRAVWEAFVKLNPRVMLKNPVMFVVWVGTIITALMTIDPYLFGSVPGELNKLRLFNGLITGILFFTVVFTNFAEAVAEGRGKAQADALRATKTDTTAQKVLPNGEIQVVSSTALRKGDRVLVIAGDIIPADGEVIAGVASVDESAITGESAPVLKEPGSDVASSVTGGTRLLSDELTIRVTADPGKGFIDRMIALVEGAERTKTPNEIALTVLLAVLTLVFLFVVATIPTLANYVNTPVSVAILIALLVALIPTTIGGLLSAISIAGMNRVFQLNVIATSGRVVEAGGDVNILILDETDLDKTDIVKPGIRDRFDQLRRMGIRTIMLTGDNRITASVIAQEAGVDDFIAEATPEDKIAVIQQEQAEGKLVAMTGDGTNDAPALAQANVGVAMNSGTQAAKEAANMVDLDSDPTKLIDIVAIGKQLLITRGALTTFSIANDVSKYFAIIPAMFAAAGVGKLNIMSLTSANSAVLSALIYNALIIPVLIPVALTGVKFRPLSANQLLQRNIIIYGVFGVIVPFIAIKAIDLAIAAVGLA